MKLLSVLCISTLISELLKNQNSVDANIGGVQMKKKQVSELPAGNPRYRDDAEAASMAVGLLHYLIT